MNETDPAFADHQRRWLKPDWQQWIRHDAHLFAPPGTHAPKTYAARLVERMRAEDAEAAAQAEQLALRESLLQLRRELAEVKFALALRRIFQKYDPNQPRVPIGDPKGGQWAKEGGGDAGKESLQSDKYSERRHDEVSAARRGGPRSPLTPQMQARLDTAIARAQESVLRVQRLDPNWRPPPSLTTRDRPEGLLRTKEAEAREAEARLAELAKVGIGPGPYARESIPARGPERSYYEWEVNSIQGIFSKRGCHTCSTFDAGTPSGRPILDHQPPSALNSSGMPQRLFPQCAHCSAVQGGWVRSLTRRRKE